MNSQDTPRHTLLPDDPYFDVLFDGPPSHESGRFVEVENPRGESIRVGEWIQDEECSKCSFSEDDLAHDPEYHEFHPFAPLWRLRIPRAAIAAAREEV